MSRRNVLALAMIGAVSLFCWQATHGAKPKDEMLELYGLFVDAVEQVESHYVRPVDRRELLESALKGMLQNLDPHSAFINTSEWRQFRKQIEGRFGGIGVPSVLGDRRKADDTWDFMLDKDSKIGYVRITSFISNTTEELKKVLSDLKADGMRGLVLDLRDNPGGLLSAAVEISDLFVSD